MARARRPAGGARCPAERLAFAALLLLAAAAAPAVATTRAMPLFEQTERERFEALVNGADVVCEARLDSSFTGDDGILRAFFENPTSWKGAPLPARIEVRVPDLEYEPIFVNRAPGAVYRLFLLGWPVWGSGRSEIRKALPWYAVVAAGCADVSSPWWWSYSRATVDTIVARARIDTLYAQAPLVVLAHRVRREMHDRDGRPVLSRVLRVDRVLKGAAPADTIVYQAPDDVRHWDRALLFLKRHGADAWEPIWPGAGVREFDGANHDTRTGEALESFLEVLERIRTRPATH